MRHFFVCVALSVLLLVACHERRAHAHSEAAIHTNAPLVPAHLLSAEPRRSGIRVEPVEVGAHGDAFVLRGGRGADRIAFLHGQCSSAHGYLDSFEFTAAARGAAMLAGERDKQSLMRRGVQAFRAAGIPAEFFLLPRAAHGQMGPDAERVMRDVFHWLDAL